MNALKAHPEKVVFALTALLACGFIGYEYFMSESDIAGQLNDNQRTIRLSLEQSTPSSKYEYSADAAIQLGALKDNLTKSQQRANREPVIIPSFIAYQRPKMPAIDPATITVITDAKIKNDPASLGQIQKIEARGDHGRVFVSFELPAMKYMEAVRVEIFRGESSADKINLKTPYAVVDYTPEIPVAAVSTTADVAALKKTETTPSITPTLSTAEARRIAMGMDTTKEVVKDKEDPKKPALEMPKEFANVQVYSDTHVDAKHKYFYALRLVGRMLIEPNSTQEIKDKDGKTVIEKIVYTAPTDAVQIPSQQGNSKQIFAAPLTKAVSAVAPTNFELRLSGTDETGGKIPPPGTPDYLLRDFTGYKASFAVRVWVTEAQDWKDISVTVGPDEKLVGELNYKVPSKPPITKKVPFDTGYTLKEIQIREEVQKIIEQKAVLNPDGSPKMEDGKMVMETITRDGEKFRNEVAILKDNLTGALEEFPKRPEFGQNDIKLKYYRKLAEEEVLRQQKLKEQIKKNQDESKAREDQRKQAQPIQPPAAPPSNVQPPSNTQPPVAPQGNTPPAAPRQPTPPATTPHR